MNPQVLQGMAQMQEQMQQGGMPNLAGMPNLPGMPNFGAMPGMAAPPPAPPAAGLDFTSLLSNQFQQSASMNTNTNPADRYRVQLQSLRDMGFDDEMRNVQLLQQHHGNVNRVVDAYLGGEVDMTTPAPAPAPAASSTESPAAAAATETPAEEAQQQQPEAPKDPQEKKND